MTRPSDQDTVAAGTRQRLVDAAVELIGERGWSAITSRAVAARAGVNNGVVHYHFGAMDSLRRAAVAGALTALFDDSVRAFDAAASTADALRALAHAQPSASVANAATRVVLEAMLHAPRDAHVRELIAHELAPLRAAIDRKLQADVAAGRLPGTTDTAELAAALLGCLDGLVLHEMVDDRLDVRSAAGTVAALLDGQRGDHRTSAPH